MRLTSSVLVSLACVHGLGTALPVRHATTPRCTTPGMGLVKVLKRFTSSGRDDEDLFNTKKGSPVFDGASEPVTKYMATNLITLSPDSSLSDAGKVLSEMKITGAPVVDNDGSLIGVLSRHDLLYQIAGKGSLRGVKEGGARSERYMENMQVTMATQVRRPSKEVGARPLTPRTPI